MYRHVFTRHLPFNFQLKQGALFFLLLVSTGCVTTKGVMEQAIAEESEWIDLSQALSSSAVPSRDGIPFERISTRSIENDGYDTARIILGETSGTHIEAPAAVISGGARVDQLAPGLFIGFGVVLDVKQQVQSNPGYQVSRKDLDGWESEHGAIPPESILLIHTGWPERWSSPSRYLNNKKGDPQFPGISEEAIDFLVRERRIHAIGIDTMSLYFGSGNSGGQRMFLESGKFHINNLTGLDKLPARGSFIMALPIKIEGAGSAPARVFALIPRKKTEIEPGKKKLEQGGETGINGGPSQGGMQ